MQQNFQKSQPQVSTEYLTRILPGKANEVLYALFILTYLVCAVIHFAHTSDTTMFVTLLPYLSAYVGIHKVVPFLSSKKTKSEVEVHDASEKL